MSPLFDNPISKTKGEVRFTWGCSDTGRCENLPVEQCICPMCNNFVEDEIHVLTECAVYIDLRYDLTCLARFF